MAGQGGQAAKDEPLTLEIDYSLSVLRPGETVAAAPLGGEALLPGIGRCATDRDSDGDDIALRCLQTGPAPSRADAASMRRDEGGYGSQTVVIASTSGRTRSSGASVGVPRRITPATCSLDSRRSREVARGS